MKPQASRADIMPVILGGDMSAYPMAREFHEAYGVRTTCVIPDPIRIIRTSSFIDTCAIAEQSDELIVDAPREEAEQVGALLKREMENAVHMQVPLTAEVKTGRSWYETK